MFLFLFSIYYEAPKDCVTFACIKDLCPLNHFPYCMGTCLVKITQLFICPHVFCLTCILNKTTFGMWNDPYRDED